MYQIARYTPNRCPVRDGVIGQRAERLPMVYHTLSYAHARIGQLSAFTDDDEVSHGVVLLEGDIWRPVYPPVRPSQYTECPF